MLSIAGAQRFLELACFGFTGSARTRYNVAIGFRGKLSPQ